MSDWSADRELELACKVGSIDDFERAIEEGANVNCDGGSPLFVSIMTHNREMISRLVELEADVGMFLSAAKRKRLKTPEQIVDALLEGAPPPVEDDAEPPKEEVLQGEED